MDGVLEYLERAEKRLIALAFFLVKLISIAAFAAALLLLEGGVLHQLWLAEFGASEVKRGAARREYTIQRGLAAGSEIHPVRTGEAVRSRALLSRAPTPLAR
jgi:hypothetical protein